MNIRVELIDFIKAHKDELSKSELNLISLYRDAVEILPYFLINDLTELLNKIGIDPLKYLNYVPQGFMFESMRQEFIIPDGIERIKSYAFARSNLREVYIPKSVKVIKHRAFDGCTNLKRVYYEGSEKDFASIYFEPGNDELANVNWMFNQLLN